MEFRCAHHDAEMILLLVVRHASWHAYNTQQHPKLKILMDVRVSFIHFVSCKLEDTAGIIIALVSTLMTPSSILSERLNLC